MYPFLDPVTKSKIHIINLSKQLKQIDNPDIAQEFKASSIDDIRNYIDESELDSSFGGAFNFEYQVEFYAQAFFESPCPNEN